MSILADTIKRITEIADFPEYAITGHILTGLKPFLPKYTISPHTQYVKLPSGDWFPSKQVVIKLNTVDVTFDELHQIYKEYRRKFRIYPQKKYSG